MDKMGTEILTRCGYRCDLCHAYKDNILKDDKREILSEGWERIFGFKIAPEDIYCDGCISSNCNDIRLIDTECKVRPCVIKKGYENCSQCHELICNKLAERIVQYDDLKNKSKEKISRSDRKNIIKPYENYERLSAIKEKSGAYSRMYNKMLEPTVTDMEKFIEKKDIISYWRTLMEYINDHYKLDQLIKYGGKNYGWEINYRAGKRSIISLSPEREAFTVLIIFGKKEIEKFNEASDKVTTTTKELIENTKQYHDGKWIWMRVLEERQVNDCITLLTIKRKPNR